MRSELSRAYDTLKTAELLIEPDPIASVNRAYYAMFYAARESVRRLGSAPKTHSGLSREVGRLLVQRGILSAEHGRFYAALQTKREILDYGEDVDLAPDEALRIVQHVRAVIDSLASFLDTSAA
jgi:uncharacterized protein (UPF0332 family)